MRGRLIGFAFMTLCLSLMLGALVVFCGESEQESQPPRVAAAIIAAPPADGAAYDRPAAREKRAARLPVLKTDFTPPQTPSADANGTPVLNVSYMRANFLVFRLSDSAG